MEPFQSPAVRETSATRCALCGAVANESMQTADDAPCPACGGLLNRSREALEQLQKIYAERLGMAPEAVQPETVFRELAEDSLTGYEMLILFEDEFNVNFLAADAERIQTIGDMIRWLQEREQSGAAAPAKPR